MGIKNLGEITGAVLRVVDIRLNDAEYIQDDLKAFGAPSECYPLAFDGFRMKTSRKIRETVEKYGVTFFQFKNELEERCDQYWLDKIGILRELEMTTSYSYCVCRSVITERKCHKCGMINSWEGYFRRATELEDEEWRYNHA